MRIYLSKTDVLLVLESLNYTRRAFQNYKYPTSEFQRSRLDEVDAIRAKILKAKARANK